MYRDFLFYLEKVGYGEEGRKLITAAVREFLAWLGKGRIQTDSVKVYYHYLSQRPNKYHPGGLSSSSIAGHLYGLRLYFSYLQSRGLLEVHPMSSLIFPKVVSTPREILSPDEVGQLHLAADQLRAPDNLTARALLAIFYGCGLRRLEAERLDLKDIQLNKGILFVREGKGGKRRAIPMSREVKKSLRLYIQKARPYYGKSQQDPDCFFRHQYGGRMRGWTFDNILKKLLTLAGIQKQISLHCLRHSIATHLLHKGVPLESVRDFLGHQHLETTQIYTRIKAPKEATVKIDPKQNHE